VNLNPSVSESITKLATSLPQQDGVFPVPALLGQLQEEALDASYASAPVHMEHSRPASE
jgi:hypothetical protein